MDDLSSHLKDAPNEADIHDKCTCDHSALTDELIDIAHEQLQLTGRMTDVQLRAAARLKAELLRQTKERVRDAYYLRKAGVMTAIV